METLGLLAIGVVGWGICALVNQIFFRFAKGKVGLRGSLLFFLTILILQIVLTIAAITTKNDLTALVEGLPGVGCAYLLFRVKAPLKPISLVFVIYALIYSIGLAAIGHWGVLNYVMNTLKWSVIGFTAFTIIWLICNVTSILLSTPAQSDEPLIKQDDKAKPSSNKWTE